MKKENVVVKKDCHCQGMLSGRTLHRITAHSFTSSRHAELVSASSRYDNNKTLKQVQHGYKGQKMLIFWHKK